MASSTDQARQILDNAAYYANQVRMGAMGYADDMMAKVENLIGHALDNYTTKYDSLVNSLQESFDMVHGDREELRIQDETETEFAQAMEE